MDLLVLYTFVFGRHSAAALVDLGLLILLTMLVLCYGRLIGHPVAGVVGALLTCASPLISQYLSVPRMDVATAMVLFALFYLLHIWREHRAQALLFPIGIMAGFSYAARYSAILAIPYTLGFVAWKLWRVRQPPMRPMLAVAVPAVVVMAPWMVLNGLRWQTYWIVAVLLISIVPFAALARPRAQMQTAWRRVTAARTRTVWRWVAIVVAAVCLWFAFQ